MKDQFPIFKFQPDLIYADSASTSQKPQGVIDRITEFYSNENANIHRGLYPLSSRATANYESVRTKVAQLIKTEDPKSIAFTSGTTDSINIVARSFLNPRLKAGDSVVISSMEHHSNLIPWQQLCLEQNATLELIPVDSNGELVLDNLDALLGEKTKLLAVTHISNTLGTINPIKRVIREARAKNIPVLVDAAQSAGHIPINVTDLDVDFLVFSAHKMFGPMGVGCLYAKKKWTGSFLPNNYGGGMIREVSFAETEFLEYPHVLEAGTVDVAGVIGLGAAIDFVDGLDLNESHQFEKGLADCFREELRKIDGIQIIGKARNRNGIVSFVVDGVHPHDVATYLAEKSIAVRAGHHCTQPLLHSMGVQATVRVSFSIYNTEEEVETILKELRNLISFWK